MNSVWNALGTFFGDKKLVRWTDRVLETLHQMESDINKSKRQSFPNIAIVCRKH